MENVTDLYAYVQTVDTRCSFLIFQAPGYEATSYCALCRKDSLCMLVHGFCISLDRVRWVGSSTG